MALDETAHTEELRKDLLAWKKGRGGNFFGTYELCGIKPGRVAYIAYGDIEPTPQEAAALQKMVSNGHIEEIPVNSEETAVVNAIPARQKRTQNVVSDEREGSHTRPAGLVVKLSPNGTVTRHIRTPRKEGRSTEIQPITLKAPTHESALTLLKRRLQKTRMLKSLIVGFSFDEKYADPEKLALSYAQEGHMPKKVDTGIEPIRLLQILHSGIPLHEIATEKELQSLDNFFLKKGVTSESDILLTAACKHDERFSPISTQR